MAAYFGKQHKNVLRDIDTLIEQVSACALNFEPTSERQQAGAAMRELRSYNMDRDGFTLLAMGFTGPRALQFKLQYIRAFNAMEATIHTRGPQLPNFSDPAEAARAWALEYEKAQRLEHQVEEDAPKVASWDSFMSSEASICSASLAKQLGFRTARAFQRPPAAAE